MELLRSCLKQMQQATKPQLADYTGLSVFTVTSLLQELLRKEATLATAAAESSGGRRAQAYRFNGAHRLALIVYLHKKAGRDTMFCKDLSNRLHCPFSFILRPIGVAVVSPAYRSRREVVE